MSARLPAEYQPTEFCCLGATAVRGPVRLRNDGMEASLATKDRWVLIYGWQCMFRQDHRGEWYETTDEPPA